MNEAIDYYTAIQKRYGNVKRAAGFYLYTEKNQRLIDMYADGGAAFFGRRVGSTHLAVKQYLDKGLVAQLPTKADRQLTHAVQQLFEGYSVVRTYTHKGVALDACNAALGHNTRYEDILWRPAFPAQTLSDVMIVCVPFLTGIYLVIAKEAYESRLIPSDVVLPALKNGLVKMLFFMKKESPMSQAFWDTPSNKDSESKPQRALKKRVEKDAATKKKLLPLLQKHWTVQGRYLFFRHDASVYADFFEAALDAHILLAPTAEEPSIVPLVPSYTELITFLQRCNAHS